MTFEEGMTRRRFSLKWIISTLSRRTEALRYSRPNISLENILSLDSLPECAHSILAPFFNPVIKPTERDYFLGIDIKFARVISERRKITDHPNSPFGGGGYLEVVEKIAGMPREVRGS
jgi:hypothetical protein